MNKSNYRNRYLYTHIEKGSLFDEIGLRDLLMKYKFNNDLCVFILCFACTSYIYKLFSNDDFVTSLKDFARGFCYGSFNSKD